MKLSLTLFFITILNISSFGQCNSSLKNYAFGFDQIQANSFSFLDNSLKNVRIIGYGEDTHGTAEFTLLVQELMKYIAEKHNFKIIILETGFGEGQYLNDYIQGKTSDLNSILNEHNSTWRYKTKEFYQFMNWLKEYNQNNSSKIQLYGCEMQYVISDVNRIKAYLKTVDSDYTINGFEKHLWEPIEEGEKSDYYISYVKLKNYFIENYETFKNKTSEESFNLAYHHIEVLGQFVTAINQNNKQRKYNFRDIYMGENIQWILNSYGPDSKALYWAHNAHVGDWIANGIVDVTGHQLRKFYGDAYFDIATDFGTGEFLAFSKEMKMENFGYSQVLENTFSSCLQSFGSPNTFLNLRNARGDKNLAEFLNSELTTMSGAGAQIRNAETETNEIGKAFDGIIYLDKTHKINWAE